LFGNAKEGAALRLSAFFREGRYERLDLLQDFTGIIDDQIV
jgi:hypothetical protein